MPIKKTLPFVFLFILLIILGYELFYAKPHEIPSPLIGENLPTFVLPTLLNKQATFSNHDIPSDKPILINVWATWCYACQIEHPMLMKMAQQYHVPIYSIDYKDDALAAKKWLAEHGNPYQMIGDDKNGDVAIDFGVYGTPETFIVNKAGKVVYKHIGVIDQQAWDNIIYPLLKKLA